MNDAPTSNCRTQRKEERDEVPAPFNEERDYDILSQFTTTSIHNNGHLSTGTLYQVLAKQ
eukprot:1462561-Pyramimonas_sp.AAC.1